MTLSLVEDFPKNNDKVVVDLAGEENKMAGYEAAQRLYAKRKN